MMEAIVFCMLIAGVKRYQFKAKYSEIVAYFLRLGNISKDLKNDNMKRQN